MSSLARIGNKNQEAIFAMGCFWCGTVAFTNHGTNKKLLGIISVKAGYTGGETSNPTYENHEGHKEAVQIIFNPKQISYEKLLDIFWHNIDPFDNKGQFCDKGFAYSSVIYYKNDDQLSKAKKSKEQFEKQFKYLFLTEIIPANIFYIAEKYHQDYKKKNPIEYKCYYASCGREKRLQELWDSKF